MKRINDKERSVLTLWASKEPENNWSLETWCANAAEHIGKEVSIKTMRTILAVCGRQWAKMRVDRPRAAQSDRVAALAFVVADVISWLELEWGFQASEYEINTLSRLQSKQRID